MVKYLNMTKTPPANNFRSYVAECARLLYWIYFKPYTFERWLRDIHPELELETNLLIMEAEFLTNAHLRRYAGQIWWLTGTVTWLAVILIAPIYTSISHQSFNWLYTKVFLAGWTIGLVVARLLWQKQKILLLAGVLSGFGLIAALDSLGVISSVASDVIGMIGIGIIISVYSGVTSGVTLDVTTGLAVGVIPGIALGMASSVASSVASGVALCIQSGLVSNSSSMLSCLLSVMAGCKVWGVAGGVALGVAACIKLHRRGSDLWNSSAMGVGMGVCVGLFTGIVSASAPLNFDTRAKLGLGFPFALSVVWGMAWLVASGVTFILGVLRFYLWLPEFLWMLILFFVLSRYRDGVKSLRYLPPYIDEHIILPLPFMDKLIVKAYRENPFAARETIDYLTTSTNNQKVASQAITGIAIDSLSRCQHLSDITSVPEQLAWIPSPPPKELGTVLPQLLDISQGVKASLTGTSSYRQSELLKRPIRALRDLQNNLAFGKNAQIATSFSSITKRWLSILETAQRTLEEQTGHSREISQVYIAGNSLDPYTANNRFKGRIDIFREIETLTLSESPPVLLLYGGRRTGKTSALKHLPHKVDSTVVPLLVDLQGAASAATPKGLAENLATQIIDAARQLPRTVQLPYPDGKKLAQDPFPALQNWLGEIERTVPSKRFLLCLDEFERLSEVEEVTRTRTLNFLRNILQHRQKWTLLFSGSHQLSELPPYWSDYLINTRALRISYLQKSEARELILQPVEDFPEIYAPTAVNAIIQLTRCQPYLVQLVCYEVVELLNREIRENRREAGTAKATTQDVYAVIPTVLERGDQYFRELWTSLEESDRTSLRCVVQGETPTAQHRKVVRKLVQKEILEKEGNAFQVPLVQRFLEQVVEQEE